MMIVEMALTSGVKPLRIAEIDLDRQRRDTRRGEEVGDHELVEGDRKGEQAPPRRYRAP